MRSCSHAVNNYPHSSSKVLQIIIVEYDNNSLYFFVKCIRIGRVIKLSDPEDSVKVFGTDVGYVVSMPDGHVNVGRFVAVEFKIQYLVCSNAAKLNSGFTFNNCKPFGFAGVEVVAPGNFGLGCRERYLPSAIEFDCFYKRPSRISI